MPLKSDSAAPARTEAARLAALRQYGVLDTAPEPGFDRLVRLAHQVFDVPMALVSLVDENRQWFKARIGIDLAETPRAIAFCNAAIEGAAICMVPDATQDPRFADNPLVTQAPRIRFYAGAPLLTPEGLAIGTLCILDTAPRAPLSAAQQDTLADLAAAAMAQLELRRQVTAQQAEVARAALREKLLRAAAETPTFREAIDAAMRALREVVGGVSCLFLRLAPDGRRLQLVSGQGEGQFNEPALLERIRATGLTVDNSAAGQAIRTDRQIIVTDLTPDNSGHWPAVLLSVERGMAAMILTPVSAGAERCCMALGFAAGRRDLDSVAETLAEAAGTLRPLLRRLRDTEEAELFRRVVDASNDPVIITDAASDAPGPRIRYANDAFLAQTGYALEEVLGQPPRMLQGPETTPEAREAIRDAVAAGLPVRQAIQNRRRDGTPYWVEVNIAPVVDETGWRTHWMSLQRDITASRAEAAALTASEAAFRDLFHQHPAPMWVFDQKTHGFLAVNEAAVDGYGWSREEFLRMNLMDIRPEDERAPLAELVRTFTPALVVSGPWTHRTATGEIRKVQVRSRLITYYGRPAGLSVIWDITERLRAEEAARDAAAELHATFESFSDGLCTISHDWRYTYVNRQAERLLRREAGELVGKGVWQASPAIVGTEVERQMRATAADRQTRRLLFHNPMLGTWFDITLYPARDGLTLFFRDVSEQHRRDERLRLLEVAAAKANDIILITEAAPIDAPGPRTLFVNQAFERLTGFRPEEIIGLTPRMLQGPRTDRFVLDRVRTALEERRPIREELLNYRKDGEEIWLELDIVPVTDADGTVTHFVAVQRDITGRKRTQHQLEQQAALLDQTRDAIVVRGTDHRVLFWNRSAERLYGWTAAEATGQMAHDLIYEDQAPFRRATAAVLAEGEWNGIIGQRRKDGTRLMVEGAWTLVRDPDGAPHAILCVNTDITERLELEQKLRQAQRLEAIGQLTGGVAHDFNNLLTVILGNSEMLADSLEQEPDLRLMAEMNMQAAERGSALTSRLLAFSRRQALDPKVIDVNRLLADLHQMVQRTLGGNIEVDLAASPGLWPALIDPPQLENAVLNLCINARDAMPQGGRLTVETANVHLDDTYAYNEGEVVEGDYVMIAVTDSGIGMTPDVLARAFEPFFTTKDVGQGSGLGLSMVFGFMKQSGGHVKIYSEPGQGTTVKMYIPRAAANASLAAPRQDPSHLLGGRDKLLVVEDDALVREHVAGLLADLGYHVVVAAHAAEALAALRHSPDFDLLFTDVVMPGGMSGPELAQAALRVQPGLRVLFTSGYTEGGIIHQGRLDPGVMLLNKPYRRRELAERVRAALDGPVSPGPAAPPPPAPGG
ncbi:PAS domain S-box protein [Falsiroseomonas selenitidurans]|uniref:PAS domain S-box protein n=1 Tax=Falsiroseomonas selenitidurans TaxID=2716335 RepID=UPI001ADE8B28|nr:PAS domain S-box protein [Falsiroseomonas selenitidurans]